MPRCNKYQRANANLQVILDRKFFQKFVFQKKYLLKNQPGLAASARKHDSALHEFFVFALHPFALSFDPHLANKMDCSLILVLDNLLANKKDDKEIIAACAIM